MELLTMITGILNSLRGDDLLMTIIWVLAIQLGCFALFFYSAGRIFRKSVKEYEFSSAFYVLEKRYGMYDMEDDMCKPKK